MKSTIKIDHYPDTHEPMPILDLEAENDADRNWLINLYRKMKDTDIVQERECWTNRGKHHYAMSIWLLHKHTKEHNWA
jgi:hypothetical protein